MCFAHRLSNPSMDNAPAPPNTSAVAIRKSANVYSMPLPLPEPCRKKPLLQWLKNIAKAMKTAKPNAAAGKRF